MREKLKKLKKIIPFYKLLEEHKQQTNIKYNDLMEIVQKVDNQIQRLQSECDNVRGMAEHLQSQCDNINGRVEHVQELTEKSFEKGFNDLLNDNQKIMKLNRIMSVRPTVWGDEGKLHVSPLASVNTCFFNLNSGEIEIGDYSFAGSNVSILTGSHDFYLQGLLRRDLEYNEGCNIKIGKGVWLASNSTILGPCEIGDNAVVAAGAVVVPGTVIPQNTIYGGIPARKIKDIGDINENEVNEHMIAALGRSQYLAFDSGWSERTTISRQKRIRSGHWLKSHKGEMWMMREHCTLYYCYEGECATQIHIYVDGQETKTICIEPGEGVFGMEGQKDSQITKIAVTCDMYSKLFVGINEE